MATQAKEVFLTPPLTIAGCRLWFDAADSSTITGTSSVTAWRDKTASLTLTGSGSTYSNVNGYPAITFNGNQFGSSRNLPYESVCTSDANFTTFIVQLTTSASGVNGIPFTIYLTDNVRRLAVFSSGGGSGGIFIDGASQASPRLGGITQTLNTPQLLSITRKNITTMTARLNGSQVSSADFPGTTNFISSSSYFVYISNGSGPWSGNMYEILHYNRDISDLEIQQIEGYLAWKWGLQRSLPRSHPFFSASPYQTLSVPISRSIPLRMSSSTYFSPTAISGCQLWMDAADTSLITLSSGSNVSLWGDKSGLGNNLSNASGTTRTTTPGGYPSIFVNGGQMTTISNNTTTGNLSRSLFMITQTVGGTSRFGTGPHFGATPPNTYGHDLNVGGNGIFCPYVYTASDVFFTGANSNMYCLFSDYNSSTSILRGIINFSITDTKSTTLNTTASPWYLGLRPDGVGVSSAYVCEIILYNSSLSTEQRQQIEGYLAWKWGLQASLPPTHPNYTVPYVPFPFPTSIPKAAIRVWSPLRVSGSQLWLDGTDPAGTGTPPSSGATVSTWVDKATAKNATATGSPTYLTGGGINFNASPYFVNQTLSMNLSQRSIFIIMQETSRTDVAGVFPLIPTPNSGNDFQTTTGFSIETSSGLCFYGNNGGYSSFLGSSSLLVKGIYNDNMNGTTGSGFFNGTNATNVTANYTAGTCSGYGIGGRWIGGSMIGSYRLNGVVHEIIMFNAALTTAQRQEVEGYLAWKWGLRSNLPAGHPYINFPPSP